MHLLLHFVHFASMIQSCIDITIAHLRHSYRTHSQSRVMDEQERIQEEMRKAITELKEKLAKIIGFLDEKVDNKERPLTNDQSRNQDQNQNVPPPKTPKFPPSFTPPNDNLPPPSHPFGGNPPLFGP